MKLRFRRMILTVDSITGNVITLIRIGPIRIGWARRVCWCGWC